MTAAGDTLAEAGHAVPRMPMGTSCVLHTHREWVPIEQHHVWPKGLGGPDTAVNKISVCANGHYAIHEVIRRLMANAGQLPDARHFGVSVKRYAMQGWTAAGRPTHGGGRVTARRPSVPPVPVGDVGHEASEPDEHLEGEEPGLAAANALSGLAPAAEDVQRKADVDDEHDGGEEDERRATHPRGQLGFGFPGSASPPGAGAPVAAMRAGSVDAHKAGEPEDRCEGRDQHVVVRVGHAAQDAGRSGGAAPNAPTGADRAKAAEVLRPVGFVFDRSEAADRIAAALADALASERAAADQLRADVLALAEELESDSRSAKERAEAMPRTDENVRHHKAEMRHARVAHQAASSLRALLDGERSDQRQCQCGHPLINHWQTGKRLCMACPDGGCADFTLLDDPR